MLSLGPSQSLPASLERCMQARSVSPPVRRMALSPPAHGHPVRRVSKSNPPMTILGSSTILTNASFYGLIPSSANLSDISEVRVEIYGIPKGLGRSAVGQCPDPKQLSFGYRLCRTGR